MKQALLLLPLLPTNFANSAKIDVFIVKKRKELILPGLCANEHILINRLNVLKNESY